MCCRGHLRIGWVASGRAVRYVLRVAARRGQVTVAVVVVVRVIKVVGSTATRQAGRAGARVRIVLVCEGLGKCRYCELI